MNLHRPFIACSFGLIFLSSQFALAVETRSQVVADLQNLYPYFSPQVLDQKIQAAQTPFQFLRSFIPYYYELSTRSDVAPGTLDAIKSESGWCVGDAHLENFGTVINADAQSVFTMNDMDDAGPCPLYLDTLRFFTGYLVNGGSTSDVSTLIDTYRDGLKNPSKDLVPTEVAAMIADSESKGMEPSKSDMDSSKTKLVRDSSLSYPEVDAGTRNLIAQVLQEVYGNKTELLDIYQTRKVGGGSDGLLRYETLVTIKDFGNQPIDNPQIIEFKQMTQPGIFPVATAAIPPTADRVKNSLLYEVGQNASPFYQVKTIAGIDMLLRPRWKGNIGVSLTDYQANQILEIAQDEIRVLGRIHSKVAQQSYIDGVVGSANGDWINAAGILTAGLTNAFNTLQSP